MAEVGEWRAQPHELVDDRPKIDMHTGVVTPPTMERRTVLFTEIYTAHMGWVFPDCGWSCAACGYCLGCVKKTDFPGITYDDMLKCNTSDTGRHVPTEKEWP